MAIAAGDVVVSAFAVAGMVAATILLSRPQRLGDLDPAAGPVARRISVVIPARNEEGSLPRLLASVEAGRRAAHEVIVVDDGSTDATAGVARSHGACVVVPGEPPAGWAGKPWACQTGADRATGELLVFLDADSWLSPDALDLLDAAQHRVGGLLSVQPHHHPGAAVEELSLLFNLMAVMGPGEFAPGAQAGRSHVAFGPCVVCTPCDYAAAGGHGAAPGAVIEDIELARSFGSVGLPVSCRLGGDRVGYRMYPAGFAAIVRGWTKNIAAGAAASRPLALAASVLWVAALAAAAGRLAAGTVDWASGDRVPWIATVLYAVMTIHLGWLATHVGRFRRTTVLLYPVPLAFFLIVFARSSVLTATRRPVRWSGRDVPGGPGRR